MRYRMILQIGAFHKPKENPDIDFIALSQDPQALTQMALQQPFAFRPIARHTLIDGTPHLLEFEAVVDVDPMAKKETANEDNTESD